MRNAYEEFGSLLLNELFLSNKKDMKTYTKVKKIMKKMLEKEFGPETGCDEGLGD